MRRTIPLGLNALVKSANPALDEAINNQIEKAIAAIHAIPQPFIESIASDTVLVQEAVDAVNALQSMLENQLLPLVPQI